MATVDLEVVSAREAEVLEALRDHLTNAEIARRLHISIRTVESHVSSLLRKLGAVDRRSLAALAEEIAAQAPLGPGEVVGIPTKWTSFIGRTTELAELSEAISTSRLVTVVGQGGVGKTRLAAVAAGLGTNEFPAGRRLRRPGPGASRVRSRGGGRCAGGGRAPPGTPREVGAKEPMPGSEAPRPG